MDDGKFDDIIRNKAESFVDVGHDAHALTDFRRRMADFPEAPSTASFNNPKIVMGSLILFSLLNLGLMWYFSEGRHTSLTDEITQLQDERSQWARLEQEFEALKSANTSRVDTVYILKERMSTLPSQERGQEQGTSTRSYTFPFGNDPVYDQPKQSKTLSGNESLLTLQGDPQLSKDLEQFLISNRLLLRREQGEWLLVVNTPPVAIIDNQKSAKTQLITGIKNPRYLPEVPTFEESSPPKKPARKKMPNHAIWALEKHNHRGIDFQYGIEGKYHKSNFEVGSGDKNGGLGFLTELIFSPTLRLETGIHIGARSYKIKQQEIEELPPDFFQRYPGYDDQLGDLIALESDADLLKVPLNLKYFGIIDRNKRWYLSGGFTPQWSTKQELDYKYALDVPEPPIGDTEIVSFVGSKQEVSAAYYTTTLNLGLGTEILLNEKLRWQLGLFYQKGMGEAGAENIRLNNSFGVKTSLWFNNP